MIRFGIVGAGKIALKFARDIKFADGAVLVAVASRNINKANEFKDLFGLEYAFGSYEEMAKSNLIDAVYIATPHNFHMEQSILFMNHQKHVLCEKPIAVNVMQFEKMVESAKENKVLLMEAMWTRFLPATLKLRELVKSNQLGKLKHANLEIGFSFIGLREEKKRLFDLSLAGGSLLDMGVYPVAFLLNITDQPIKELTVKMKKIDTGIDTECIIDITFKDNSTAHLVSSLLEDRHSPGVIEFENGTIIMDNFWRSEKLSINDVSFEYPHLGEGFPYEILSFVQSIEKKHLENDIMTHDQTRKTMQSLDRIRESCGLKFPFES